MQFYKFFLFYLLIPLSSISQELFHAKVSIRRSSALVGKYQKLKLSLNNQEFKLKNGETRIFEIQSDTIKISSKIIRASLLNMPVEDKTHYFVKVNIGGLFFDKPKLRLVRKVK